MRGKILPQEQKEKSTHRESSRLRNQPRKDYKTIIPQFKIPKKVEFQKLNNFLLHTIQPSYTSQTFQLS